MDSIIADRLAGAQCVAPGPMATDTVTRRILCFEYQNVLELACTAFPGSAATWCPQLFLHLLLRGDAQLFSTRYTHT
jgi:hypothetical protein